MSAVDVMVAVVGVLLIVAGLALAGFMTWAVVSAHLQRQRIQRERLLAEARLDLHTHEAMGRLYEAARRAQTQRSSRGSS